ncbi:hypothetical protein FRC17_008459 [Serendipita sp. 399]|nr:hypothetical protein FRC17_008459 [Serendipita sp. 399]
MLLVLQSKLAGYLPPLVELGDGHHSKAEQQSITETTIKFITSCTLSDIFETPVQNIREDNDDPDEFALLYEKTLRGLDTKQMFTETMETTEARIRRVSRKARINMQDNLGQALLQSWELLKSIASDDFEEDDEIRLSNLPELMQFLLELASPPLPSTLVHADIILSGERELSKKDKKLTWTKILEEEPLEGEHWEEILNPTHFVYDDDGDSLSSWGSDGQPELVSDTDAETPIRDPESPVPVSGGQMIALKSERLTYLRPSALTNREIVEGLRSKQSWRPEWNSAIRWNRPFNVADPSTLGATADSVSSSSRLSIRTITPRFFDEVEAVRNTLLIIQGIDSPLFTFLNDDYDEPTQASVSESVSPHKT